MEGLELRMLMHGAAAHVSLPKLPANILTQFDESGHIKQTAYSKLPAKYQKRIDAHRIEDDRPVAEQYSELTPVPASIHQGGGDAAFALPDLVPLTSGTYLKPTIDKTEQPGRNLLRFTTAIGNQGDGPAILYSGNTSQWQTSDGRQIVKQRLFNFTTSFTQTSERDAGYFIYHPTHGHFHLEEYARYTLLNTNGTAVFRSDGTQAVGDKVGFCLVNISSSFTMTSGVSSTTLPGYNKAGQPNTTCGFVQGIHVGYADVYDKQYDGQWIDVTGVANGNYLLEVTLDASNAMQEKDETNNTVRVPVTINTTPAVGGIAHDEFDSGPGIPNNDFAHAADLGQLGVATKSGLTMHADSDVDFFKFTATSSGSYNVELSVANRIVNLYLYDDVQKEIGRSTNPRSGTAASPTIQRITYSFEKGKTYYARAEGFSGSDLEGTADTGGLSDNYAIKFFIKPSITTAAPIAAAAEDGLAAGSFKIDRNGPFSSSLLVAFSVGGTAQRGVDYDLVYNGGVLSGNNLTIGVESLSETIQVVPRADVIVETGETVTLTLSTDAAYVVDANGPTAIVTIADAAPLALASDFAAARNEVRYRFSLDVSASLADSDLQIIDTATNTVSLIGARSFTWDGATKEVTFVLSAPLPRGTYRATLAAGSVTHALGAPMASDASVTFSYLPADGNLSGVVDFDDLVTLAQHYGAAGVFGEGDYNYDGHIDFDDLVLLAQNYNASTLPPVPGAISAGIAALPGSKARGRRVVVGGLL